MVLLDNHPTWDKWIYLVMWVGPGVLSFVLYPYVPIVVTQILVAIAFANLGFNASIGWTTIRLNDQDDLERLRHFMDFIENLGLADHRRLRYAMSRMSDPPEGWDPDAPEPEDLGKPLTLDPAEIIARRRARDNGKEITVMT